MPPDILALADRYGSCGSYLAYLAFGGSEPARPSRRSSAPIPHKSSHNCPHSTDGKQPPTPADRWWLPTPEILSKRLCVRGTPPRSERRAGFLPWKRYSRTEPFPDSMAFPTY